MLNRGALLILSTAGGKCQLQFDSVFGRYFNLNHVAKLVKGATISGNYARGGVVDRIFTYGYPEEGDPSHPVETHTWYLDLKDGDLLAFDYTMRPEYVRFYDFTDPDGSQPEITFQSVIYENEVANGNDVAFVLENIKPGSWYMVYFEGADAWSWDNDPELPMP